MKMENRYDRKKFLGSEDDCGLYGVNKNERLQIRLGPDYDPAFTFSTYVNGDPLPLY